MPTYSREVADKICDRMMDGESVNAICRDERIPVRTVRWWALEDIDGFAARFARAREMQAEFLVSQIVELADESDGCRDSALVNSYRLRVDTRKWIASKVLHKQYGDKVHVGGDTESPLKVFHQVAYVIVDPKEPADRQ